MNPHRPGRPFNCHPKLTTTPTSWRLRVPSARFWETLPLLPIQRNRRTAHGVCLHFSPNESPMARRSSDMWASIRTQPTATSGSRGEKARHRSPGESFAGRPRRLARSPFGRTQSSLTWASIGRRCFTIIRPVSRHWPAFGTRKENRPWPSGSSYISWHRDCQRLSRVARPGGIASEKCQRNAQRLADGKSACRRKAACWRRWIRAAAVGGVALGFDRLVMAALGVKTSPKYSVSV